MTDRDALRAAVARRLAQIAGYPDGDGWRSYTHFADAAIAVCARRFAEVARTPGIGPYDSDIEPAEDGAFGLGQELAARAILAYASDDRGEG